jgi:regulatory protein
MPPAQITAIEPAPRQPQRMVIKVGGRTLVTLPRRVVEELHLAVGQELDAEQADRLAQAAACDRAVNAAGAILSRRALSGAELAQRLTKRGVRPDLVAPVIQRLRRLGLLDDEELGRALIRETLAKKPAGPALLRAKLARRSLDSDLIERLLAEPATQSSSPLADAFALALGLARAQMNKMASVDRATQQRRLYGLLARRGFDEDTAQRVIETVTMAP